MSEFATRSLRIHGCSAENSCPLANNAQKGCPMTVRPEVFFVTGGPDSPGQTQGPLSKVVPEPQAHVLRVISKAGLVVPKGANLVLAEPGSPEAEKNSDWECGLEDGAQGTVMIALDRPQTPGWTTSWQRYVDNF